MDILLINPFSWTRDGRASYLPYGILYLASYLRKRGVDVDILDCNVKEYDPIMAIDHLRPKYIGLSVLTGPVIKEALNISRETKERWPDIKVIWGGLHPTLFPEYCKREESVDYVIRGEGEEALFRLIRGEEYESIYDKGQLIDLNNEPMPAWDLVDIEKYIQNKFYGDRVLTINSSRGCPNACAFCFNQGMNTHRWRGLNAENLYKQVEHLYRTYGIDGIQFYEDSFDVSKQRVKDFCNLLLNSDIDIAWSHFANCRFLDRNILVKERDAGCKEIGYGVESGSNRILKLLNKNQTIYDTRHAFKITKEVGIKPSALFMVGLPTETMKELNETKTFINRLNSYQDICTIYRPYPGTPLHDTCGLKMPETLVEQADFYAYGELTAKNVSEVPTDFLNRLQRYFYRNTLKKELYYCIKELNIKRLRYLLKGLIRWFAEHISLRTRTK